MSGVLYDYLDFLENTDLNENTEKLDAYPEGLDFLSSLDDSAFGEDSRFFWNSLFNVVCNILAGSGIVLNLVIIVSTFKLKLKTSLKLVVSLATADVLVAAFHVAFAFIYVMTPWSRDQLMQAKLQSQPKFNNSFDNTFDIGLDVLPVPTGLFSSLFPSEINSNTGAWVGSTEYVDEVSMNMSLQDLLQTEMTDDMLESLKLYLNSTPDGQPADFYSDFFDDRFPDLFSELDLSDFNMTEFSSNGELTTLQAFLSAFYLMPNLAAVLSMLAITTCLLITVLYPLKQHLILSKRRGTILVLTIWTISAIESVVVFFFIELSDLRNKNPISSYSIVAFAHLSNWLVTMAIFIVISFMYIIIVYQVTRKRLPTTGKPLHDGKTISRATVTALAITGSYAVCYLPFVWLEIVQVAQGNRQIRNILWYGIMQSAFLLNTNVDAIIYALRLPEVVTGLKRRLKSLACKN